MFVSAQSERGEGQIMNIIINMVQMMHNNFQVQMVNVQDEQKHNSLFQTRAEMGAVTAHFQII